MGWPSVYRLTPVLKCCAASADLCAMVHPLHVEQQPAPCCCVLVPFACPAREPHLAAAAAHAWWQLACVRLPLALMVAALCASPPPSAGLWASSPPRCAQQLGGNLPVRSRPAHTPQHCTGMGHASCSSLLGSDMQTSCASFSNSGCGEARHACVCVSPNFAIRPTRLCVLPCCCPGPHGFRRRDLCPHHPGTPG
jgi:hypothetical protein